MRLLIFGDSFACDGQETWTDLLRQNYEVVNCAQAGSSEYRIWLELQKKEFGPHDNIIVCHTSPYRIYTECRMFDYASEPHANCDLIYADVKNKSSKSAQNVSWWFENVYDLAQADFMHQLLVEHIQRWCPAYTLHLSFFDINLPNLHNLHRIWRENAADSVNHLSSLGNHRAREYVQSLLRKS